MILKIFTKTKTKDNGIRKTNSCASESKLDGSTYTFAILAFRSIRSITEDLIITADID